MTISLESKSSGTESAIKVNGVEVVVIDATGIKSGAGRPVQLFNQNVTSGTTIVIPDLPVGTKRIKISGGFISTSGTSDLILRIGPTAGVEVSDYNGVVQTNATRTLMGTGFQLATGTAATSAFTFQAELHNYAANSWVFSSSGADHTNTTMSTAAGFKTISGSAVKLVLTTLNGTDTFDAGRLVIETEIY